MAPEDIPNTPLNGEGARKLMAARPRDQIFQNDYGLFNAGLFERLWLSCPRDFEVQTVPIDPGMVEYIQKNVGINEKLMASMTRERKDVPVYIVTLNDEQPHLMIDGHHRLLKRWRDGQRHVKVVLAPMEITRLVLAQPGPMWKD